VLADEEKHEEELMGMLDEESLRYAGSVVLGLNDALVELTGALAGLTFAFRDSRTIALAGLITGISASFSMAASDYLSTKADEDGKNPLRSAIYTGLAYIVTVFILIIHTWYPAITYSAWLDNRERHPGDRGIQLLHFSSGGYDFKQRFTEMAVISLGWRCCHS
jgi:hypothetical protein